MADQLTGLAGYAGLSKVPQEQLRFAVVLNGGVSLAVWMGGVVLELDRLTKASREGSGAYALMQRLTGSRCRADVISGTSAGGINGAALALTQVNRDADPSLLRDLWTDQGRIESLLRPPFRGQPTSLLQGDEYFLPRLHTAMEILSDPTKGHREADTSPIDLTITTTVLKGNQSITVDSMGQRLPQRLHAGRFQWQRYDGDETDLFSPREIRRTAHRLALASRASASFPFAFEPAFIPVCSPDHREPGHNEPLTEEVLLRPDMAGQVRGWGEEGTRNRSRYVIDGGALANTPTHSALEAIERMPAKGPVRRVMLLVFPHAPDVGADPEDRRDQPPTAAGAMTGFLGALTAQGSRTYVEALERHNLLASGRRGTRSDILGHLDEPAADSLRALSDQLFRHYQRLRLWRAARDLAAWRTGLRPDGEALLQDLPPEWNFERVRTAAEAAQQSWLTQQPLPYVPSDLPDADTVSTTGWQWGVTGALGVTEAVSDLLRGLVAVMEHGAEFETITRSRRRVLLLAQELRRARDLTDDCWRSAQPLTRLAPNQSYWTLRLACYQHLMLGGISRQEIDRRIEQHPGLGQDGAPTAEEVRAALADALAPGEGSAGRVVQRHVLATIGHLRGALLALGHHLPELAERSPVLADWHRLLAGPLSEAELLTRLLHLEVASTMLGDEVTTGATMPIELVQISAAAEVPFADQTRTADDKLGGWSVARFGGFLKRSWRVNDWIWGRIDGATVLSKTVLQPTRIRRTAVLSGFIREHEAAGPTAMAAATILEVLRTLAPTGLTVTDRHQQRLVHELRPVFDLAGTPEGDLPSALPALAAVFATALHLELVASELPALGRAVRADRVDGANPRSRGELFLAEHEDLLARLDAAEAAPATVTPADRRTTLQVFDRAGIGREPMGEEATSDLMIRTGSTAAAVLSTVMDSDHSGLSALKPVTRALRGAMLLPYWTVTGLTSRQSVARSLALLGLAFGAVLLVLSLFSVLPEGLSGPAAAVGASAVLAAFAYAALRTGSLLHGVVLLTPLIPLIVFAVTGSSVFTDDDDAGVEGGSTLLAVLAVTLALMLLGSISYATRSVWAALDAVADARLPWRPTSDTGLMLRRAVTVVAILAWVAAGLALLVLAAVAVRWLIEEERILFVRDAFGWLWLVALLVVVGAGTVAHVWGRQLQVLTFARETDEPRYAPVAHPDATAASWAVVYGTGYLVVAWVLSLESVTGTTPSLWQRVGFATATVLALALLVLAPALLPLRAVRGAVRAEVTRGTGTVTSAAAPSAHDRRLAYAAELVGHRISYRRFVTAAPPASGAPPAWAATLSPGGERLEQRVCDARAATALRKVWQAPRVPTEADFTRLLPAVEAWRAGPGSLASDQAGVTALVASLRAPHPDPAEVTQRLNRLLATLERRRVRRSKTEQ